jgi:hypothetical protein
MIRYDISLKLERESCFERDVVLNDEIVTTSQFTPGEGVIVFANSS